MLRYVRYIVSKSWKNLMPFSGNNNEKRHITTSIVQFLNYSANRMPTMTHDKDGDKISDTDSEVASYQGQRVNKIGAIIYPTVCALLLVSLFGGSFLATRMIYDKYDSWCTQAVRFDVTKLVVESAKDNATMSDATRGRDIKT